MKKKLLPIIVLASVLGMSTLVGCNQDSGGSKPEPTPVEPTEVKVTGVSLNKTEVSLEVGGTETLVATVAPSDATNKNVSWSSSNASVVSVADGVLTAKKAGKAEITVKTEDGNFTARAQVTVTEPAPAEVKVTDVTLNKHEVSLFKGGSETLVATVLPENATNKAVTWKSDDKEVVTVVDGVLTAVDVGTAEVTVTTVDGKKTDKATVVVTIDVKSISFSNKEEDYKDLEEGDDFTLTVSIDPVTNAQQLMDAGFLTITSSDPEVASVPAGGFKVFALKEGTATITASLFGKTAELELNIARRIPNKEKYGTEHEGNAEDPFTNEDALKVAKAMEGDRFPSVKEKYAFYIKGEVESFYSSQLPGSNQTVCSWYLKPNSGTEKFEAYKIEKDDGSKWAADDIWVGAVVTFTATKLAVFNGQYETATGKVVKIEGTKPEPQKIIPATIAEALEVAGKLESGESTYDKYEVEGFITEVTTAWDSSYKNLSFKLAAEEGGEQTITAYRCGINAEDAQLDAIAAKLIPGAQVKVTGVLTKHVSSTDSSVSLQFAQGCMVDLVAEAEVKPLESLDVAKELTVIVDDAAELVVKPVPASAKLDNIKFVSTDETIATVSTINGKFMVDGKAVGETTITVSVGDISATVSVKVIGAIKYGTEEAPLTVDEAIALIDTTGADLTNNEVWLEGIVTSAKYNSSYGNFDEVWLQNEDGSVAKAFELYQIKMDGELNYEDVVAGKHVVAHGFAKKYNTTYELAPKGSGDSKVYPLITVVEDGPAATLTGITLNATEKALAVGDTFQLTATPVPVNAELGDLVWESSDDTKVTVVDGLLTALAATEEEHPVTVTVTSGEISATCAVTVTADAPHGTTADDPLSVDEAYAIAQLVENNNENDGNIYFIEGDIIAINSAWYAAKHNISVDLETTEHQVFRLYRVDSYLDGEGNKVDLTEAKAGEMEVGAHVIVSGYITKYNTTYETAQGGTLVSLTPAPIPELTGIALNKESLSLGVAGEETLTVSPVPPKAELGAVTWESDHPEVATVDENGKVTAVAAGTATITATCGDFTDTCTVTVTAEAPVKLFELATTFENGCKYVIGANANAGGDSFFALAIPTGEVAKNPAAVEKDVDALVEADAWDVAVDGEGHIVISYTVEATTYYLEATNAAQGIKITTTSTGYWTLTEGGLQFSDGGTRILCTYNDSSFRYYSLPTISGQAAATVFYKYVGE